MIKILFVFSEHLNKKGGTEKVMMNIFENIDKKLFHIDFLLFDDSKEDVPSEEYLKENGANIYYIVGRGKNFVKHKKQVALFFKNHKYDIIHSHMDAIGAECLKEAKKNKYDMRISHSHNTNQLPNPKGIIDLLHKILIETEKHMVRRYATHYIACSTEAGEWLFGKKICKDKNKYMLFKNAINLDKYTFDKEIRKEKRAQLGIEDKNCLVIGHIGRFDYQKNHEFVVAVFEQIIKENINSKLVLVGDGEYKEKIKNHIENSKYDDNVIFLENRNDVNELLMAFDIFILPSRYEGLSLALIEAEASGVLCFVSDKTSKESELTDVVEFLPITDSLVWKNAILRKVDLIYQRKDNVDILKEEGFDIKSNIHNLEQFYINGMKYRS